MFSVRNLIFVSLAATGQLLCTAPAEGGPLLDWLLHRNRCCRPACPPVAPVATCQTTCQQTCSRVVVNYVPHTAYRCEWERIPVTTYQQTSSTDPCTGCTVTCNRPCTTYTWQMKQVPYTTYRPVYTQETYQVPVTYSTQVAAPMAPIASPMVAPGGCSTCATGYMPTVTNMAPVYTAPQGTLQMPVGTSSPVYQSTPVITSPGTSEADLRPSLEVNPQEMQLPIIEGSTSGAHWPTQLPTQPATAPIRPLTDPSPESRWQQNTAPQLLNPFNQTTQAPSIRPWDYSPVRQASYEVPVSQEQAEPVAAEFVGTLSAAGEVNAESKPRINEGWRKD
jgi:hypothetical protein